MKKSQQLREILVQVLHGLRIRGVPLSLESLSGFLRLSKMAGIADALEIFFNLLLIGSFNIVFENFEHKLHPAPATAAHVLFASVWLIYLPFSHIFRIFFRHYLILRWDNVPNLRGSLIERKEKKLLDQPIGWSGFHIPAGEKWGEVVSGIKRSTVTDQR